MISKGSNTIPVVAEGERRPTPIREDNRRRNVMDNFEERLRRKLEEGRNVVAEGETRRKELDNNNSSSKREGNRQQRLSDFEEKSRCKMENHSTDGHKYDGPEISKANHKARPLLRRHSSWVSSMTEDEAVAKAAAESLACEEVIEERMVEVDKSDNNGKHRGSIQQRLFDFEEKFRRKMESHSTAGSKYDGPKHSKAKHKAGTVPRNGKARRRFRKEDRGASSPTRPSQLAGRPGDRRTKSMPVDLDFDPPEVANEVSESPALNGKFSGNQLMDEGIGDGVQIPVAAADREARLEASGIDFEDIFAHLRRFSKENGTLTIPVSHPFLTHILNTLSAVGMEELLSKHWDRQLLELRAFKEKYGDCMVPEANPVLGAWARIQRDQYLKYATRLPNSLTKERVNKLKDLGFDKFVSWEQDNKQQDPKHGKGSLGRASSESEEAEAIINPQNLTLDGKLKRKKMGNKALIDPQNLPLDEKIKRKKQQNRAKFMERGMMAHHSLSPNKEGGKEPRDDAAVDEKMHKKRMLLRTARRGLGQKASSRIIAQTLREDNSHRGIGKTISSRVIAKATKKKTLERGVGSRRLLRASSGGTSETIREEDDVSGSDGDAATSPPRVPGGSERSLAGYSFLIRSSSCSDLSPGSWECRKCTFINKPAGLGEETAACRVCGAWECGKCAYFNEGTSSSCAVCDDPREDGEGGGGGLHCRNFESSKDDLFIDSMSSLGNDVLHAVMDQSRRDFDRSESGQNP